MRIPHTLSRLVGRRLGLRSGLCLLLALLTLAPGAVRAADYYVDNKVGDDALDGRSATVAGQGGPFASIAKAVALLQPGDTLHLAPSDLPYHQSILLIGTKGEPGKPITIDGHGAWLTGADPLSPTQWRPADTGPEGTLVLADTKLPEPWANTLCIDGEFLWGDSNQDALPVGALYWLEAGKTLYLRRAPEQAKAMVEVGFADGTSIQLPPEKWGGTNFRKVPGLTRNRDLKQTPTWVKIEGHDAPLMAQPALDLLPPGHFYNDTTTFYYRPPIGKSIEDMRIQIILRSSGVALGGVTRHLVIQNLNVVYVGNDGYNIHNDSKDVIFRNCNAFYAGDEGYSSHDVCETTLDGGIFLQCGNGVHNVNSASTQLRNVIVDSAGLRNDRQASTQTFRPNEVTGAILIGCGLGTAQTQVDDVLIVNGGMSLGAEVSLKRVTTVQDKGVMRVEATSSVRAANCFFAVPDGTLTARLDDPSAALSFADVWYHPSMRLQSGARPPFTVTPLAEWMAAHPDHATGSQTTELDLAAALASGSIPAELAAGMGCSRELMQRYLDFVPKHQAMLDTALDMAWKEMGVAK